MSVAANTQQQAQSLSLYALELGWAATAGERRALHWELLACDAVHGVFPTARDDVLAVLFSGDALDFRTWAGSLAPEEAW